MAIDSLNNAWRPFKFQPALTRLLTFLDDPQLASVAYGPIVISRFYASYYPMVQPQGGPKHLPRRGCNLSGECENGVQNANLVVDVIGTVPYKVEA